MDAKRVMKLGDFGKELIEKFGAKNLTCKIHQERGRRSNLLLYYINPTGEPKSTKKPEDMTLQELAVEIKKEKHIATYDSNTHECWYIQD
jgi:hypothetical protein